MIKTLLFIYFSSEVTLYFKWIKFGRQTNPPRTRLNQRKNSPNNTPKWNIEAMVPPSKAWDETQSYSKPFSTSEICFADSTKKHPEKIKDAQIGSTFSRLWLGGNKYIDRLNWVNLFKALTRRQEKNRPPKLG